MDGYSREDGDVDKSDGDDPKEMDPLRMILDQLGNQYIILNVHLKEFISQQTLNKSINL